MTQQITTYQLQQVGSATPSVFAHKDQDTLKHDPYSGIPDDIQAELERGDSFRQNLIYLSTITSSRTSWY